MTLSIHSWLVRMPGRTILIDTATGNGKPIPAAPRLTGAPYRRRVEIGEGTHMVIPEKNRRQAIDAIPGFLGEAFLPTG